MIVLWPFLRLIEVGGAEKSTNKIENAKHSQHFNCFQELLAAANIKPSYTLEMSAP